MMQHARISLSCTTGRLSARIVLIVALEQLFQLHRRHSVGFRLCLRQKQILQEFQVFRVFFDFLFEHFVVRPQPLDAVLCFLCFLLGLVSTSFHCLQTERINKRQNVKLVHMYVCVCVSTMQECKPHKDKQINK